MLSDLEASAKTGKTFPWVTLKDGKMFCDTCSNNSLSDKESWFVKGGCSNFYIKALQTHNLSPGDIVTRNLLRTRMRCSIQELANPTEKGLQVMNEQHFHKLKYFFGLHTPLQHWSFRTPESACWSLLKQCSLVIVKQCTIEYILNIYRYMNNYVMFHFVKIFYNLRQLSPTLANGWINCYIHKLGTEKNRNSRSNSRNTALINFWKMHPALVQHFGEVCLVFVIMWCIN